MNIHIQCDKCNNVYPGNEILLVNNFGTAEFAGAICVNCFNSIRNFEADSCEDTCHSEIEGQMTIDDFISNDNGIEVLTDVNSSY